ncbi:alpha/beta fold hydrolase [Nocardia wallacei]|uniref:alpha/beta fold hydrolase n=1 Tax=Nocardia wallacei TaxID=480035 RepID=UPI002453D545|nr:alpha/beta hydrolase [Nocardia wallacei]
MAKKIGRFENDAAQERYLRAYEELERLWPVPSTELTVRTSFGPTHVRRCGAGEGAPIVLLPGLEGTGLSWHPVIEELSRERVVYAPDVVGTPGKSVQTAPIATGAEFARWLRELLSGLDIGSAHLVGMSQGGWYVALAGIHRIPQLATMTLVDPAACLARVRWSVLLRFAWVGLRPTDRNWKKLAEWLTPGVVISDRDQALARAGVGYRMRLPWPRVLKDEQLQSITVPTLALFGAETVLYDPEPVAQRTLRTIPISEAEIYPGASHGLLFEIPEQVIPRILRFIRKHEPVPIARTEDRNR